MKAQDEPKKSEQKMCRCNRSETNIEARYWYCNGTEQICSEMMNLRHYCKYCKFESTDIIYRYFACVEATFPRLILSAVICLSQRLSHACLSTNNL